MVSIMDDANRLLIATPTKLVTANDYSYGRSYTNYQAHEKLAKASFSG